MANLLLTQKCVRACPYCFAKEHMSEGDRNRQVSWEDFIYVVDFLQNSNERHISLLGGEPLLHEHAADFISYLFERDFDVAVFTSGALPEFILDDLKRFVAVPPEARFRFVCNLNEPRDMSASEAERLYAFLSAFGTHVAPGFNIYRPDFDLLFLADLIDRYGMRRDIRLGMAAPIPDSENACLDVDELPQALSRLSEQLPALQERRLTLGLDCGFPLCMFTDADLGRLWKNAHAMNFGCGPAIDIGPDLQVWSCFPLRRESPRSLFEFQSLQQLHQHFEDVLKTLRDETGGILPECGTCSYRESGKCAGGCVAHILKRRHQSATSAVENRTHDKEPLL